MYLVAAAALAAHVAANTIPYPSGMTSGFEGASIAYSKGGHAVCVSGNIAITASAQGIELSVPEKLDQFQVTDLTTQLLLDTGEVRSRYYGGPQSIAGTYRIAATLCLPRDDPSAATTIEVLLHGLGSDRTYWDIAPGYSWVDAHAMAGYATLAYDRIGAGASEHPDPFNIVQFPIHTAILAELVRKLRGARLGGGTGFEKIVLVGQTLGGGYPIDLLGRDPRAADAIITLGIGTNFSFTPLAEAAANQAIANQNDPVRFAELADGYLVFNSPIGAQYLNWAYPYFDRKIFYDQYAEKSTYAFGEVLVSARNLTGGAVFTGPVDIIVGESDYESCGESCSTPTDQSAAALARSFPRAASGSRHFVVPQCGHNVNGHYGAPKAFEHSIGFLQANGL